MASLSSFLETLFSILMIAKSLNLFCNLDDLSHILTLLIAEKLSSHVDELTGGRVQLAKAYILYLNANL